MVAIKLGSGTSPFSHGVSTRSLRGKLFRSHFLRGQTFGKLIYKEIPIITNKSQTTLMWCECQHALYKTITLGHVLSYDTYLYTCIYKRTHKKFLGERHFMTHIHVCFWQAFSCYISHVCTFFERLLMLPTHKYTYFERHFYATYPTYTDFCKAFFAIYSHTLQGIFHAIYSHTLQGIFHAIYSHTLQGIFSCYIFTYNHTFEGYFSCYTFTYMHTIERYFSCYLGARSSSWGNKFKF